jgi:molecular chaperone DnaK (HSP70)
LTLTTLAVSQEALDKVGLEPRDMTEVVIMGGVSRIPFIHNGVSRFFEREVVSRVNPEEAVALGTGLRAAQRVGFPVCGTVSSPV